MDERTPEHESQSGMIGHTPPPAPLESASESAEGHVAPAEESESLDEESEGQPDSDEAANDAPRYDGGPIPGTESSESVESDPDLS